MPLSRPLAPSSPGLSISSTTHHRDVSTTPSKPGLAQLYSDNLALEVMKGLTKKAQTGGTPYRAPIGYLNKRRFEGMADIRWVELDPERAPLIRWAFEEYATGTWSLAALCDALTDKGLRSRPTSKRASQPISINGLHKLLTNAYYAGIVPFQGAYYDGTHEAIIDLAHLAASARRAQESQLLR